MSWTINRQPQFRTQPKDHCLVWVYALFTDKPGDYVKKPMRECTGKEICMEWLYHIGVPENQIVPEVWGSVYDIRDLLNATVQLRDGKKPTDMKLSLVQKVALEKALSKIKGTDIEKLLKEYNII